jgi:hypothetical protein
MKRIHYIVLAAILTVGSGCSELVNDPTPQLPDKERSYIFFNPVVDEAVSSKAGLIEGTALPSAKDTDFGVIGYYNDDSLFSPAYSSTNGIARVYRPGDSQLFQYDNLMFWLHPTEEHDFYAYYPYQINGAIPAITSNNALTYSQPSANDASMVDLMTAHTSTGKCAEVGLTFNHRLWALDVVIKNSQTEGLNAAGEVVTNPSIYITGVKLHVDDFPIGGTIPLDGSDPTPNTTTADYTYTVFTSASGDEIKSTNATSEVAQNTKQYGSLLFLPGATLKYRLEIAYVDSRGTVRGNNTFYFPSQTTYQTSTVAFAEGNKYTLTINKTNDTFVVGTLTPTAWTDVEIDHEFN